MGEQNAGVSPETLTELEDKAEREGGPIAKQGSFLTHVEDAFSVVPLSDKLSLWKSSHFKEEDYEDLPPVDIDKRKCTNFLFLILFILWWFGMLGLAGVGYKNGNPNLLVYGTDNEGNLCGEGVNSNKQYLAFPRLSLDVYESVLQNPDNPLESLSFFGVCLNQCPNENELVCSRKAEQVVSNITSVTASSREEVIRDCIDNDLARLFIGLTDCRSTLIRDECFETDFNTTSYLFRCFPEYFYEVQVLEDESGCTKFKNFTNALGGTDTRCIKFKKVTKIIEEEPTDSDFLFDSFNSAARIVQGYIADIYKSYPVILTVGILVSTVIGFIYVSSLWCCVGLIVWLSIILALFILVVFTLYCYAKAGILTADVFDKVFDVYSDTISKTEGFFNDILNQEQNGGAVDANATNTTSFVTADSGFVVPDFITTSTDFQREYEVAAYSLTAITGIVAIMILVLIPRIVKAIEIFNEASHAVRHNPALLLVPPVSMLLLIANLMFYLFAAIYISSSGEIVVKELNLTVDSGTTIATSEFGTFDYTQAMNLYLLMGFFWTLNMITGIGTMTIAGVITAWYWAGSGKTGEYGYGIRALSTSFWVTCRFHLGSVAMGSFLIALIEVIRLVAAFISQRVSKVKQDSRLVKILLASINCFLKLVEKCIKFVSRNSFIMTAMYGPGFCRASSMAFFAIAHNLSQVATVTFLGDIIMRFGQLLISALCGLICWYVLDNDPKYQFGGEQELSQIWFPVLLCMILAFILARSVLAIYDVAVDTILLSYCQDRKRLDLRGKVPTKEELKSSDRFNAFIDKHKMNHEDFLKQPTAYGIS